MFAVCLFSYNRGHFLQNAIESVNHCLPYAELYIIDDASDDPFTQAVLKASKKNATVIIPSSVPTDYNTGGLYPNMNYIFSKMEQLQHRFLLCLQDDQQIVRHVSMFELEQMLTFFNLPKASFVLQTCFLKTHFGCRNDNLQPMNDFLYRPDAQLAVTPGRMSSFAATGIFDIKLMRETVGCLCGSERENEQRARSFGLRLGFLHDPFMHWLPFPVSYLGKRRRIDRRLADVLAGAGVHKIAYMKEDEVAALKERTPCKLAYAEDWLRAPSLPPHKHWTTMAGYTNLLARGGWRKHLANLIFKTFHVTGAFLDFANTMANWLTKTLR